MRVWLLGLAVVVVVGSGVAIAAATNVLSDDAASEPTHVSYCDAVGAGAPIDEVVSLAPPAVEAVVREVRDAPAGSERALEARNLWAYYNNNHCCDCYDAKQAPEIAALTPEQRARVAAGGAP
ncbi:MAG TPA: hypothetical protein VIH82_09935 [Acidimicrobiia bacterium]